MVRLDEFLFDFFLIYRGVEVAARAGYKVLEEGGSALDAVETAVTELENNPIFDAGTGSLLNLDGEIGRLACGHVRDGFHHHGR